MYAPRLVVPLCISFWSMALMGALVIAAAEEVRGESNRRSAGKGRATVCWLSTRIVQAYMYAFAISCRSHDCKIHSGVSLAVLV